MHLVVIGINKTLVDCDNIDAVKLPGSQGEFQILTNHANIVSQLIEGEVKYKAQDSDEELSIKITKGISVIHHNNVVVVIDK